MINRRQFLQITRAGAAGLLAGGIPSLVNTEGAQAASKSKGEFIPDLDISHQTLPSCRGRECRSTEKILPRNAQLFD